MTLPEALKRITELEALLEHAVYVTPEEWEAVRQILHVSQSQACILIGLFKAGERGLNRDELDAITPLFWSPKNRADPEFRGLGAIRVQIYNIRQKWPSALTPPTRSRWQNFRLSEEGRRIVGEALGA